MNAKVKVSDLINAGLALEAAQIAMSVFEAPATDHKVTYTVKMTASEFEAFSKAFPKYDCTKKVFMSTKARAAKKAAALQAALPKK